LSWGVHANHDERETCPAFSIGDLNAEFFA
jgi:hypothetical protein